MKLQLGTEDLILLTKKVGERGYQRMPLDTYGKLPDFDNSLMWPLPEPIPLKTPPKGRSHKKAKRPRNSPDLSSSLELSPKKLNLNASSSDSYITDDMEEIEDRVMEKFEKTKEKKKKKTGRK